MIILKYDSFITYCDQKKCLRGSFISENCEKDYKRKQCYIKYVTQINSKISKLEQKRNSKLLSKVEKDRKYLEFVKHVWLQDCGFHDGQYKKTLWKKYCSIWNILTVKERWYVEQNFLKDKDIECIASNLDVCHIYSKGSHPELKYTPVNGVVCSRYFHMLLDGYKHPVTRDAITSRERLNWFKWAKDKQRSFV